MFRVLYHFVPFVTALGLFGAVEVCEACAPGGQLKASIPVN